MKIAICNQRSGVGFGWVAGCAVALLLACAACWQPGDERQIKNAVSAFYDVYMKVRPSGVPTKEEQPEFKKVISTGLAGLLDEAFTSEEKNTFRETKIEGDLFSSLDQGALSYKILQCETQTAPAACLVELTSVDDRNNAKFAWKDRVFLVREGDRWVVDDIEFLGDRPYMHKGRLKDVLRQIIEEAKKPAV
ncbi:MAG TPA: DUF3828 domain-containing protein [Candidatus Binatia bacterium]|jgi:hypothetical protein